MDTGEAKLREGGSKMGKVWFPIEGGRKELVDMSSRFTL